MRHQEQSTQLADKRNPAPRTQQNNTSGNGNAHELSCWNHTKSQREITATYIYTPTTTTRHTYVYAYDRHEKLTCELLLEMDTNTSVSELRDLLIATVSFSLSPVALDRLSLSLPARSTRWRVPFRDDRCAWFTAEMR